MKTNKIPQAERLRQRISNLKYKEQNIWLTRKDNPYPYCKHCGITNVYLSIEGDHWKHCPFRGWDKQLKHYEQLLKEALEKEGR